MAGHRADRERLKARSNKMRSMGSLLGLRRGSGLERGAPFHSCAQAGSHPRKGTRGQGQRTRAGEAAGSTLSP